MFLRKRLVTCNLRYEFLFLHCWQQTFGDFLAINLVWVVVPNMHIIIDEIFDIRISLDEPEKLMQNSFPIHFLCREKRQAVREVESYLTPKKTICIDSD